MPLTSKLLVVGGVAIAALAMTARYGNVDWHGTAAPAKAGASTNRLGYLSPKELPDSIALLPPPPAPGSSAMQADEAARTAALPLRGTARYRLAALEAPRTQANTVDAFLCAFGTDISTARTPKLMELLSRVRLDVRAASYLAKGKFNRPRPFVVHNSGTC